MAEREVSKYLEGLEDRKDVVAAFVFATDGGVSAPIHVTSNGDKVAGEYTKHLGNFVEQANGMLREMEEDNQIQFLGFRWEDYFFIVVAFIFLCFIYLKVCSFLREINACGRLIRIFLCPGRNKERCW